MDILNHIVYPQSAEHLILLKYLLFITLMILLPYLSILIGTLSFSLINFSDGKDNYLNNKFSKDIINIFTPNKVISFSLGIVPLLSIALCLAQLLFYNLEYLFSGFLICMVTLVLGIILLYMYKYGLQKNENSNNSVKYLGIPALLLILFSTYLFLGLLQIIISQNWNIENIFSNAMFSASTLLYFLSFFSISFVATSCLILFKFFKNSDTEKPHEEEYKLLVKKFALRTGLLFSVLQPLLFVLSFLSYPLKSLSFAYFAIGAIILLLMLLVCILFYKMYTARQIVLSGETVFFIIILFAFVVGKDIMAFDTASIIHFEKLKQDYVLHKKKLLENYKPENKNEISGEAIFNNKCSACHRFDRRLVGPAYKKVLPKYEGHEDKLINFILHPRKINPELPIMPAQGLKPNEAKAIAKYIMQTYKK